MCRLVSWFLVIVLTSSAAAAKEQAWSGPGSSSCSEYANAVRASGDLHDFFFSWAQGFMSGLNTSLLPIGAQTDLAGSTTDAQQRYIDDFYDGRPLATYVQAVLALYDQMRKEQGLREWRSLVRGPN